MKYILTMIMLFVISISYTHFLVQHERLIIENSLNHKQDLINRMTGDIIMQGDLIKGIKEDIIQENNNDLIEKDYNEKISFLSEKLNVPKECFENQYDGGTFFHLVDSIKCNKFKNKFTKKDAVEFSIYNESFIDKKINIIDYNYNEVQ